jgi:hypothetical protein
MNPETVIRPWLRLVGHTWGNTEVHDYRWADASTKPQVEYFTYKIISMVPTGDRPTKHWTPKADNTTLNRKSAKQWLTNVQIDLYRSQNGMAELAKCITAAQDDNPTIKKFFNDGGCALRDNEPIQNLTVEVADGEGLRENYHHRVIVRFYEQVSVSFEESNEVVQKVNITLGEWDTE